MKETKILSQVFLGQLIPGQNTIEQLTRAEILNLLGSAQGNAKKQFGEWGDSFVFSHLQGSGGWTVEDIARKAQDLLTDLKNLRAALVVNRFVDDVKVQPNEDPINAYPDSFEASNILETKTK